MMNERTEDFVSAFFLKNCDLLPEKLKILEALELMLETCKKENTILICGNGGSAADAEHIVGELMKGFLLKRPVEEKMISALQEVAGEEKGLYLAKHLQEGLPAISLVSHIALMTAFCNDVSSDMVFAQQVLGYSKQAGCMIGLSTSGNSQNVVNAANVAKACGIKTLAFTGSVPSELSRLCDICIQAPATSTYLIQEYHIKIYHLLCAAVEYEMFEI